jgi:hypothetical protein
LVSFIRKISTEYSKLLQWNWQKYLENSVNLKFEETIEELRKIYYDDFAFQIKNKIVRNYNNNNNKTPYTHSLMVGKLKLDL